MQDILQYLLKWSIALAAAYLFYRLVLRPLTFYQWNRRYLILYSIVAFFIPFINITTYVPPSKLQGIKIVKYIPVINISTKPAEPIAAQSSSIDVLLIAGLLIVTGSIILCTRLFLQWRSLRRIRKTAVPVYHPEANVYHVNEHVIPFSFGNAIYVNTSLHSERELQDIILHEFVHVRQKHSMDIIWSEILCILNWYNPFAWLIRHAIRQNLEFIADQAVLNNGLDKKTYQYHLLKVIGSPQYSIANNFNFSSLKKRIAMMNRLKSARVHLVKFVFVLPLLAVLLLAFRNKEGRYKNVNNDTIPHRDIVLPDEIGMYNVTIDHMHLISLKEFYRRNHSVKQIAWSDEDELIVYLKNGRTEVYNTDSKKEMKKFVEMYGGVPTIMVPPPAPDVFSPFPPVPGAPEMMDDFEIGDIEIPDFDIEMPDIDIDIHDMEVEVPDVDFEMPDIDCDLDLEEVPVLVDADHELMLDIQDDDMEKFRRRNPDVDAVMWGNDKIIIKKKDRVVEVYTLSDKKDMKSFREKYGEPPLAPPPPPGVPVHPRNPRSVSIQPATNGVVIGNKNKNDEVVLMADQIVVHGSEPTWNLKHLPANEPIYYLNAKKSTKEKVEATAVNKIFEIEVISNRDIARQLGEEPNVSILNMITKENANQKSARLSTGIRAVETHEQMEFRNMLYHGIENPIVVNAAGVPAEGLVITMNGGQITKKNGRYYAIPQSTGNVEIKIYRSTDKGLKLLNKRVFRVRELHTT